VPADIRTSIDQMSFGVLADYQSAVGGLIEAVDVPALSLIIYVNDSGLICGVPVNDRATALWPAFVLRCGFAAR
jgi:hypothetical protein